MQAAKLFALFGMLAGLLGIGTITQVNGITAAVNGFFADENTTAIIDDHVPFLMPPNEFAAIDFIDFEYGSAPGRHDYWHTAEDTLDKLSPRSLLRVGTFALALLRRIEEGAEVPPGIRPPPPQE